MRKIVSDRFFVPGRRPGLPWPWCLGFRCSSRRRPDHESNVSKIQKARSWATVGPQTMRYRLNMPMGHPKKLATKTSGHFRELIQCLQCTRLLFGIIDWKIMTTRDSLILDLIWQEMIYSFRPRKVLSGWVLVFLGTLVLMRLLPAKREKRISQSSFTNTIRILHQ